MKSWLGQTIYSLRKHFYWAIFFSMIANLMGLAPSLYMLQVFDRVMVSQSELSLFLLSMLIMFLFFILALAEWIRTHILIGLGERLESQLGDRVYRAAFAATVTNRDADGERYLADLNVIRQFLTGAPVISIFDMPWVPVYVAIIYLIHPMLGIIAILGILLLLAVAWVTEKHTSKRIEEEYLLLAQSEKFIERKFQDVGVIHSMGMFDALTKKWHKLHLEYTAKNIELNDVSNRIKSVGKFIRYGLQSVALGAGALLVIDGVITMWTVIVGNMLLSRATAPIDGAIGSWSAFTSARQAYSRIDKLLKNDVPDARFANPLPRGQIEIDDLSLTIGSRLILDNIRLSLPAGETTAIVGPSAAGKSSLTKVILGIWAVEADKVLIDGQPLPGSDDDEYRKKIGYLPQDVQLMEGSVAENIARFAQVDSSLVIEAAKLSGVHEMIQHLPQGYDTPVGLSGVALSGGQRQRIGLARALFGKPALIVLDEPNANLDDAGEAALNAAISAMQLSGAAILIITHRPPILSVVHNVLLMEKGKVQWFGTKKDFFEMQAAKGKNRK